MALVPQYITDHITDQYAPYCSELGYGAINDIRMLDVIRFLEKASNPSSGHHYQPDWSSLLVDNQLITFL